MKNITSKVIERLKENGRGFGEPIVIPNPHRSQKAMEKLRFLRSCSAKARMVFG
jgi:predicted nicotinamide N-methyase